MQQKTKLVGLVIVALFICTSPNRAVQAPTSQTPGNGARPGTGQHLPHYILGPNDEITILSLYAEEIANKTTRITTSGDLNLPLVGRIHVAGMTLEELEVEVADRLKTYYRQPDVAINVVTFKSQPVSVFGYVGSPGLIQLEGKKTLIEVLALAGGLRAEAGSEIKITRKSEWGPIPLPSAKIERDYSSVELNIRVIENAGRPEENIEILPYDIITVARADIVYVLGEVRKPGGFALTNNRTISLIELLARAEGTAPGAAVSHAKLIRRVPDSTRVEEKVDIKAVLNGKSKDIQLQPEDILYVPASYTRGALRRTLDTAVAATTGAIIYRY